MHNLDSSAFGPATSVERYLFNIQQGLDEIRKQIIFLTMTTAQLKTTMKNEGEEEKDDG